ncbi:uncharacterized protein LOC133319886 [Danaus plexippus]|uniref:uncharacterized protein LOC133319886 n=1 Tax=Danaus plexippus TaxID=13037 RepID=UPI002AB29B39|nr:uncharacterized protein LOC133319886 [Danaus plexippus]
MKNTLCIIGAYIIIFAHVHSFVLLTANFDDVKKLAQKFVSESLAEKIAEFVSKATVNKIGLKLSNEEDKSKMQEIPTKTYSESEDAESETTKESISKENMKYKAKALKNKIPGHKTRFESKLSRSNEKRSKKDHRKKKDKKIKKTKRSKEINLISETNNLNVFSDDSSANNASIESTAGWFEEGKLGKNLTSDQETESDYVFRFNNVEGVNEGLFRDTTLTTRRDKNEFDQYDNTYYPKAVGTSGSVTLRLLDSRKSRYRKD